MEVLDPLLRENYLTDSEISENAWYIAHSPLVQRLGDRLDPVNADYLLEAGVDNESLDELRRMGFVRTICHAAIAEIMGDGKGRSEMHMATEACRVNFAFHKILKEEVGLDFVVPEGLDIIENLRSSGTSGLWRPLDTPISCPTIDGFPVDRVRHLILQDTPRAAQSFHNTWFNEYRNDLYRLTSIGIFEMLKPPLLLTGGNIMAGSNPRFFAQKTKRGNNSDETTPPDIPKLILN